MRCILLVGALFVAGCAEPSPPIESSVDGPSEDPPNPPAEPLTPQAPPTAQLDLQVFIDDWSQGGRIDARTTANATGAVLELQAATVSVQIRAVSPSNGTLMLHAYEDSCCAYRSAGPWTIEANNATTLELPPGRWMLDANSYDHYGFDSLVVEVTNTFTIHGVVEPAPVDVPGRTEMQEIRLHKDKTSGNAVIHVQTEGDIRDVRLGLLQGNFIQCADAPRDGQLAINDVFMEAHLEERFDTARVLVGAVDQCSNGYAHPLNVDPARYVLTVSI